MGERGAWWSEARQDGDGRGQVSENERLALLENGKEMLKSH